MHDEIYNNYMNNHFKFNQFQQFDNFNVIYISGQDITPLPNDYLLVTDIQSYFIKDYYDKYMNLFKKEHKICMIYECLMHNCHNWKIKYIFDNFGLVFQNTSELAKLKNIHWIPTCNLFIKHDKLTTTKTKFCAISPIFDLGLNQPIDPKRIERLHTIKQFCDANSNIHVYGSELWSQLIKPSNYIGKLPNEDNVGMVGKFDLEYKINNKCKVLSEYKFIIVFENMYIDGYITEKLVEGLYSDNVVVYYGPKNIKTMYPDLFDGVISGHDYTIYELLDMMNNMTDNEYSQRVEKIKLLRDELNCNNSSENVKKYVVDVVEQYIEFENKMCNNSLHNINKVAFKFV